MNVYQWKKLFDHDPIMGVSLAHKTIIHCRNNSFEIPESCTLEPLDADRDNNMEFLNMMLVSPAAAEYARVIEAMKTDEVREFVTATSYLRDYILSKGYVIEQDMTLEFSKSKKLTKFSGYFGDMPELMCRVAFNALKEHYLYQDYVSFSQMPFCYGLEDLSEKEIFDFFFYLLNNYGNAIAKEAVLRHHPENYFQGGNLREFLPLDLLILKDHPVVKDVIKNYQEVVSRGPNMFDVYGETLHIDKFGYRVGNDPKVYPFWITPLANEPS